MATNATHSLRERQFRESRSSRAEIDHPRPVLLREPLGDQRAVARARVALMYPSGV
jgi:hypothetical protein